MPVNPFGRLSNEIKWNIINQSEPEDRRTLRQVNQDFRANVDSHLTVRRVKTHRILADVLKSSYAGNIDSLDLSGSGLNDTRLIATLGGHNELELKGLKLKNNNIGDGSMTSLSQIKSLEKLDLSDTFVTAEGVQVLTRLPKLHSLVLTGNTLMGELGAVLPQFSGHNKRSDQIALRELDLSHTLTSEKSMMGAAEITSLIKLNVQNNRAFSNSVALSLSSHENLEELNVSGVVLNSESLKSIADIRNLKILNLRANARIGDEDIRYLCNKNKNLEQIDVRLTDISDQGIAAIAQLPNLKKLSFYIKRGQTLGDEAITALKNHKTLSHLEIEYFAAPSSEALKDIASIQGLKLLKFSCHLNDNAYDAAHLAPLAQNASLEELTILNGKITAEGTMELANIPNLKILNFFTGNQVSINHQTFTRLINHPTLQELRLNHVDLSVDNLVESPESSKLETLAFRSQDPGADHLVNMFTGLNKLKNITIESFGVTEQTLMQVANSMPALEVINLGVRQAGEEVMAQLARMPGLEKLTVFAMSLTTDSIRALSNPVSLQELEIKYHRMNRDFLPALLGIKGLDRLNISNTRIDLFSADINAFLNSTIQSIRLGEEQIDENSITEWRNAGLRVDIVESD